MTASGRTSVEEAASAASGPAPARRAAFVEVAVPLPVTGTFTYSVPSELAGRVEVGVRVLVPFGRRKLTGFVVGVCDETQVEGVKNIIDVLDVSPVLDEKMIELTKWVADYYLSSWGEVMRTALPPGINMESRRYVSITEAGREALASGELEISEKRRRLLEIAGGRARTSVSHLLREAGMPRGSHSDLYALANSELIEIEEEVRAPRTEVSKESVISLVCTLEKALDEAESTRTSAPKQAMALELLANSEGGRMSLSDLRQRGIAAGVTCRLIEKGLVEKGQVDKAKISFGGEAWGLRSEGDLTREQEAALASMTDKIASNEFGVALLHGVTGSGKTRVYREAIAAAVSKGRGAIVLVPEIALTPQMLLHMKRSLEDKVAVVHSGLSLAERYDTWRAVKDGLVSVVVGPRSAVFAPVRNLGIIVVDEEHEHTYKQGESPRYHARDVAIMRGKLEGALVVLGTATPGLETYLNALEGKYDLLELPERIDAGPLPLVHVVDMRDEGTVDSEGALTATLKNAMEETLAEGKQIILFLNRRGFASFIQCVSCGYTARCTECNVALTYHSADRSLKCHYCDHRERAPEKCPECGGANLRFGAPGTQRVELAVKGLFPDATVARMDVDTTTRKGSHWTILKRFADGETDILLGTQMIAKGLDFPSVGLVGVVSADVGLNLPDFRAGERTFQLLTQVAGRTGRGSERGRVIVQTYLPDHYTVSLARTQEYAPFFEREVSERKLLCYPPFGRLVSIVVKGRDEAQVSRSAQRLADFLVDGAGQMRDNAPQVLGPAPAPLERIKGICRWQVLIRGQGGSARALVAAALEQKAALKLPSSIGLAVDVDPLEML